MASFSYNVGDSCKASRFWVNNRVGVRVSVKVIKRVSVSFRIKG